MKYEIKKNEEAEYTIFFYNCLPNSRVTFDLEINLYNSYGGKRNYLSAGDASLPNTWYFFTVLFSVGLVYWCINLRDNWAHKQQIHLLMTLLCVLKVLTMLVDALKLSHEAKEGAYSTAATLSGVAAAGMPMGDRVILPQLACCDPSQHGRRSRRWPYLLNAQVRALRGSGSGCFFTA
jgi:hypothetical protein